MLYAAFDVTDDSYVVATAPGEPWVYDSVELYLDGRQPNQQQTKGLTPGAFQILVVPTGTLRVPPPHTAGPNAPQVVGVVAASARTERGYVVEVAVPLTDGNFLAGGWRAGRKIKLAVMLNDNDDPGSKRRDCAFGWALSPGGMNHADTSGWAEMRLGAEATDVWPSAHASREVEPGPQAVAGRPPSADLSRGLVGHWAFDEVSGKIARDSSGNNSNGALTNMTGMEWDAGTAKSVADDGLSISSTFMINNRKRERVERVKWNTLHAQQLDEFALLGGLNADAGDLLIARAYEAAASDDMDAASDAVRAAGNHALAKQVIGNITRARSLDSYEMAMAEARRLVMNRRWKEASKAIGRALNAKPGDQEAIRLQAEVREHLKP